MTPTPGPAAVRFADLSLTAGESQLIDLVLDTDSTGTDRYRIVVTSSSPHVASITRVVPVDLGMRSITYLANGDIELVGVNPSPGLPDPPGGLVIASLEVRAEAAGTAQIDVSEYSVSDRFGRAVEVVVWPGLVNVMSRCPTIPGGGLSADPNRDGRCEDVNGDGTVNYEDVVTLFEAVGDSSIPDEDANALDFNGNGRVDFADVVTLYEQNGEE